MVASDDVGFAGDLDKELLTHGPEESLDFPRASGRRGVELTRRTPSLAHARNNHASTNAEPRSTYTALGTPREASAGRSAAASRTLSSAYPHR